MKQRLGKAARAAASFASLLVVGLCLLPGCKSSGTCIVTSGNKEIGDTCVVNATKSFCDRSSRGQFFKESAAAGQMRCKQAGYKPSRGSDVASTLQKGSPVTYHKAPKGN